jgi:pilus assembly protein Flp/PilA
MAHAARRPAAHSDAARPVLKLFSGDEHGATAIEYAMIASIISIVIVTALASMTTSLEGMFSAVLTGFH